MMSQLPSTSGYASEAPGLLIRYEAWDAADVLGDFLPWVPTSPARILDIGSGTGRDAAFFAAQGHAVLAVEPTTPLRDGAAQLHPDVNIRWLDDALPGLEHTKALGGTFDLILMNAVWMHLTTAERDTGMMSVASLLSPDAHLLMTLRHGPVPEGRRMFDVSGEETIGLAARFGLSCDLSTRTPSVQPKTESSAVAWTKLVFRKTG